MSLPLPLRPLPSRTLVGPLPVLCPPVLPRTVRVPWATHYVDFVGHRLIATGCAHLFPRAPFTRRVEFDHFSGCLRWDGHAPATATIETGSPVSCPACLAWWAEREAEDAEVTAVSLVGGGL